MAPIQRPNHEFDSLASRVGTIDLGTLDEAYPAMDPVRVERAARWRMLGRDAITGAERWQRPDGSIELRYADGTVDLIEP
jgi:hypothetical protein